MYEGSESNRQDIATLGQGIAAGVDTSVCLLNYRKDGTPFYNQIYVAPLRDAEMKIINYVGVQVEVSHPHSLHLSVSAIHYGTALTKKNSFAPDKDRHDAGPHAD